jgi:uncharacterized delta-60 repeat protein
VITTNRLSIGLLVVLATAMFAHPAAARPGGLDPTFGGAGTATIPLGSINAYAESAAVQPDGKLIVAGNALTSPNPTCVVARFLPSGALDASFGPTGDGIHRFSIASLDCRPNAIALRPDGRMVIGGRLDPDSPTAAASLTYALTATGTIDSSWSDDGWDLQSLVSGDESITDLALMPDGEFLALSDSSDTDTSVATRFTSTGDIDTTWASSGLSGVGGGRIGQIEALADNRFLASGRLSVSGERVFRLARLVAGGGLFDSSFGVSTGTTNTAVPGSDADVSAMTVQADGKIILAGSLYASGNYRPALVRYTAGGLLDPTFGTGGIFTATYRDDEYFNDVAIQADGKILAVGASDTAASTDRRSLITRLNPDGTPDANFGTAGVVIGAFGGTQEYSISVEAGPDGKIYLAGNLESQGMDRIAVGRLIGGEPYVPVALSTTISSPSKKKFKAKKLKRFSGTATGDGLSKVQISLLKSDSKLLKKKRRCLQMSSSSAKLSKYKAVKKKCVPKKWLNASGTTAWSYKLKKTLKPGKYTLYVRSMNALGLPQAIPTKKNFTLTK